MDGGWTSKEEIIKADGGKDSDFIAQKTIWGTV